MGVTRILARGLAVVALATASAAQAAAIVEWSTTGTVGPTDPVACADPFAGCALTAVGVATSVGGSLTPLPGPWAFSSEFRLVAPLSPTTFRTEGTFLFDDPSAADDDLYGYTIGVFDATTFSNTMDWFVTGGGGRFAGLNGTGRSLVQVIPTPAGFAYVDNGRMAVPEPASIALFGMAVAGLAAGTRRRRRG